MARTKALKFASQAEKKVALQDAKEALREAKEAMNASKAYLKNRERDLATAQKEHKKLVEAFEKAQTTFGQVNDAPVEAPEPKRKPGRPPKQAAVEVPVLAPPAAASKRRGRPPKQVTIQ